MPPNSSLATWFITEFDTALRRAPQKGSVLKDTVEIKAGVGAATYEFFAMGKGLARTVEALQPIQPDPTSKVRPTVTIEEKAHYQFISDFQATQLSVGVGTSYGITSRNACERACDQWIINALVTSGILCVR